MPTSHLDPRQLVCHALVASTLWTATAHAADFSLKLRQLDRNVLKLKAPELEPATPQLQDTLPALELSLTLGAAYEREQAGGHSASTPFLFSAVQGAWEFDLSGGGYTRSVKDGVVSTGLADLAVSAAYSYEFGRWTLGPSIELAIPTHGAVGSSAGSQTATFAAAYKHSDKWSWSLTGSVAHVNEADPGVSRYMTTATAKGIYSWRKRTSAFVAFNRNYTRGGGGSAAVAAEFDFPISTKFDGSISTSHTLTPGQRSHAVEFDLTYSF